MKKISTKIMSAIIMCSLFTALLTGGMSIAQSTELLKQEANEKLVNMSEKYANQFSNVFENVEGTIDTLSSNVETSFDLKHFYEEKIYLENYKKYLDKIIKRIVETNTETIGVYFTFNPKLTKGPDEIWYARGEDGIAKFVDSSELFMSSFVPPYLPDMNYYFNAIKSSEGIWTDPYFDVDMKMDVISYSKAVYADGELIGVAGADIATKHIRNIVENMKVYESGYALLMNQDYDFLIHPFYKTGENLKTVENGSLKFIADEMSRNNSGVVRYQLSGENKMMGYSHLSNVWIIAVTPPIKEIFYPVKILTLAIMGLTLLGIAISIILSYIFSNRFSTPLSSAVNQLKIMELGDFSHELPKELLNRDDDLGEFAKAVASMQNVIRNLMKEVQDLSLQARYFPPALEQMSRETQIAASQAAMAIEQISIERVEQEENLRETLKKLEEFNTRLQLMVAKEVEENRKKDAVMIYQSRLAKMGEMIGNIAHQWRQPLNNINLILSNISDAYAYNDLSEEALKESAEKIKKIIKKMSETIDDFIWFLKPYAKKEKFSIYKTIAFAAELMEETIKYNDIELKIDKICDSEIYGYSNEFSQVVFNILNNAKDALVESRRESKRIDIKIYEEEGCSIAEISNNGGNIDKDVMDKIFMPYFTTKTDGKGTGIGLYMSKLIIEEHMNGKIVIANTDDGVCCRISIPQERNERND